MRVPGPSRDENGSTLIELLMATTLSVVLMSAVVMTFIVGQRTNANSATLLNEANDTQLVTTWLPADLQSVSPLPGNVVIGNGAAMPTENAPSAVGTGCSPEPVNDANHFNALRLNWMQIESQNP